MIEVGRVCMKTAGREAGKYCVIIDVLKDGMVLVTGPKAATKVKRRKCSIHHVEPTPLAVKIKKNATDDEVLAAYRHAGVFQKIGTEAPTAKEIEASKESERKRMTQAKAASHKPGKKEEKAQPAAEEKPKEEHKKPEHHAKPKAEKKEEHKPEHHEPKAEKKAPAKKKAAPKKK